MALLQINVFACITIASLVVSCVFAQQFCSLDPNSEATHLDVLVLGAGITGIAAAKTLNSNGIYNFMVIEATDRIGGRIREYDGTSIEVGANWIHGLDPRDPNSHPIWREWVECDEDGPDGSFTPDFTYVYDVMGNPINISDENGIYYTREEDFFYAYDNAGELNATIDESLRDGFTINGWEPQSTLDNFIEWVHIDACAADTPERLSLLLYTQLSAYTDFLSPDAEEDDEGGDFLFADEKGYSFVTRCMARYFDYRVRLNSFIETIHTADDCVCATVRDGQMYCGQYAIVTFSTGVLQAAIREENNTVQFDPPLPQWKQDAINNATPVHYGKIHLIFNYTFWEVTDEDQQIWGYVSDQRGYYGYYVIDNNRPNQITVDVAEYLALKVSSQSDDVTVSEVMAILRKIFGDDIPEPHTAIISKWDRDPLFRCAYTAFGPGVPEKVFDYLLEPVNERLFFAGSGLNATNYGYTHGGYGTGVNAAREILSLLGNVL